MKKLIIILCLTFALCLSACAKPQTPEASGSMPETDDEAVFAIEAGGLELKYPAIWQDKVTVSVTEDKAAFSCGDAALFDLLFNHPDEGILLGTVLGEKNTVISVVSHDLESDDNELRGMQDAVNVILDHLSEDYEFVIGVAEEVVEPDVFDIETPVATLKYPLKWKDKVTIEVTDGKVSFSNEGTPLFDLVFSEGNGYLLGRYNGTPIYVVEHPVSSEEQIQMKDDVNVILDYLSMDEAFE